MYSRKFDIFMMYNYFSEKGYIMKLIKRSISVVLSVILSISLFSCNERKVLESSKEEKTVVKQIGDIDVPLEMYRYVALNYKASYEANGGSGIWLGEEGRALILQIEREIDETLIDIYTVQAICEVYGISVDDAYIVDTLEINMENTYESYGGDYELFADELSENYNMNDSVYRFFVRNEILSEELLAKMAEAGELPDDNEKIKEILLGEDCVRVKQILIAADNGNTERENQLLAELILSKLRNGADFDALVEEYGEDLYMFNNDAGYYVTRGTLHKDFEDAAFALEVGEISDIVKTDAGFSIIKKYEKEDGYIEKNLETLAEEYISGLYNLRLEEFNSTLEIKDTDKMQKYSIFNLDKTK